MKSFETYPSEKRVYTDRISGIKVTQLTSFLCNSYHEYFTNNGLWQNGREYLFISDRGNATNLFTINLESGEINRLTDYKPGEHRGIYFANDINPVRPEVYCYENDRIYAYDLTDLETRFLYQAPEGFHLHGGLVGADGKYTYITLQEDLSSRIYTDMGASYIGFAETFEAHPDCRIVRIDTETGKAEELWQENCWIGHVNPSPTQPTLMTFCHEGPWHLVDQRLWFMDTRDCKPVMLRPRKVEGEGVGHEYWFEDGLRVGYQAHQPGVGSFFGVINYDGSHEQEAMCVPFPSPDHVHSVDFNLIVSDSGRAIKLYKNLGDRFDDARVLAMHDGSFFHQFCHPHPRMMPGARQVLYNSNVTGYCQLYLADIPEDVMALPKVADVIKPIVS
ncbi:MAG: oligogalacturonide lyase [Firmicutes bacterium]|nr:oligogalacturonide lyase [Bacillota bacterium]